jgi:ABC-type uncharacterized transport system permease subunit
MMSLVQYNGWWYVVVQEHGRSRIYQLENPSPTITWKTSPVIDMTPGGNTSD